MVTPILNFYNGYTSLRGDEQRKLMEVVFVSAALLALGIQTFGSLPLKPIIATIVLADVAFYYFAQRYPELYTQQG